MSCSLCVILFQGMNPSKKARCHGSRIERWHGFSSSQLVYLLQRDSTQAPREEARSRRVSFRPLIDFGEIS